MNRSVRIACGVVILAALWGCKKEETPPKQEAPATAPARTVSSADAVGLQQRRVIRRDLGTFRKTETISPSKGPAPTNVWTSGSVSARGIKASQVVVWLGRESCAQVPADATPFMRAAVPMSDPATFALYAAVPEGGSAWLCAAAVDDAHNVVAEGRYAKNPLKVGASEKVDLDALSITLKPRKSPAPISKGLLP